MCELANHSCSLCFITEANVRSVVSKGYVSGLLRLYEEWRSKDTEHVAIAICHALLRCLHQVTHSTAGRQALISQGGLRLLYETTQVQGNTFTEHTIDFVFEQVNLSFDQIFFLLK